MTKVRGHKVQAPTCAGLLKTVDQTIFPPQILQMRHIDESGAMNALLVTDEKVI